MAPLRDFALLLGLHRHRARRLVVRRGSCSGHLHDGGEHHRRGRAGAAHQDQELDFGDLLRGGRHLRPHHRHHPRRHPRGVPLRRGHGLGHLRAEPHVRLLHVRLRHHRRLDQPLLRPRRRHRRFCGSAGRRGGRIALRANSHRRDLRQRDRPLRTHRRHPRGVESEDGREILRGPKQSRHRLHCCRRRKRRLTTEHEMVSSALLNHSISPLSSLLCLNVA